jgi:hypothetical protein
MNFVNFLASKSFLRNLGIAIAILLVLFAGTLVWLRVYTHHGQAITVPDLTGLDREEVQKILDSKNLRYEVTDSIFYKELPRGTVARQNPKPGSKVKEMRRIYLTMNAVNPEKVTMPSVTGVSLRQARATLESYGLNLGKISYRPDMFMNRVLEQRLNDSIVEPGVKVLKGSSIDLVLGKGLSDETTAVPDLVGLSLFTARNLLADRYLNINAVIYDKSVTDDADTASAFIWRQRPEFQEGNTIHLGANVDVWLTVDSTRLPLPDTLDVQNDDNIQDDIFN